MNTVALRSASSAAQVSPLVSDAQALGHLLSPQVSVFGVNLRPVLVDAYVIAYEHVSCMPSTVRMLAEALGEYLILLGTPTDRSGVMRHVVMVPAMNMCVPGPVYCCPCGFASLWGQEFRPHAVSASPFNIELDDERMQFSSRRANFCPRHATPLATFNPSWQGRRRRPQALARCAAQARW